MSSITVTLAEVLAGVKRPGDFCTTGIGQVFAPALEVKGVGPIALPFLRSQFDQLIAAAERAPYGRGDQTLVDVDVRRSWQIDAKKVEIRGQGWAKSLAEIVGRVANGLGVTEPINAKLYKLLVYDEGGFFVSHRDTEKAPGMFATLIVVLPSVYTGGELVVRHQGREIRFDAHGDDPSEVTFAAFYADCLHEILPVTSGCRLALVYNLLRKSAGDAPEPPSHDVERAQLTELLRQWSEDERPSRPDDGEEEEEERGREEGDDDDEDDAPPAKLIYPLEHVYTQASLSFEALKGADAARAATLLAATRAADCDLHLALLSIEESGSAVYTGYGYRKRRRKDEEDDGDDYDVVEIVDCEETLSEWRRPDGRAAGLGVLPVLTSEVSPPDALDDIVPDKQSFFEATGNEGATFERSYRKAALVVWPNRRRLAIIDQGGLQSTLPYLAELTEQWTAGGRDRQSPLWALAHELSSHMVASWPASRWASDHTPDGVNRMLSLLGRLDDTANIERFLAEVSVQVLTRDDSKAILQAMHPLPSARKSVLLQRIVAEDASFRLDVASNLLAEAATAAADGSLDLQPADLLPAASALLAALPGDPAHAPKGPYGRPPDAIEPGVLVDALNALAWIDAKLAGAAVDGVLAWPKTYGLDEIVVPAVLKFDQSAVSPAMMRLRTACTVHLNSRIAEPLAPPSNWKRASAVGCKCERCRQLSLFLANPTLASWHYRAVQADRGHVEDTIQRGECDVDTVTLRVGSPHTLACTKNQASYERRVRQREQDLSNLAQIEKGYAS